MRNHAPSAPRKLRFSIFELDLRAGELRRSGMKVKLQEQPFRILAMLLERPGEVVTREELQVRLWPGKTYGDFEHSINIAVKRLREALGDSVENPRFVETLPRHGYRFIAPLSGPSGQTLTQPNVLPEKATLAILPLENLSGDPAEEYFVDGMTEELITQLGGMCPERLGVIARTTAMKYKQVRKGVDEIGRELGVDYILEGSVRREADRVRVSAQLIQVRDQAHLWAASYDRELSGVLALQSEVARAIANEIQIKLTPQQDARLASAKPVSPEAYEAYLKGRYYWNRRTPKDLKKAIQYFREATTLSPHYGPAYGGMSDAYAFLPAVSGGIMTLPVAGASPKEVYSLAREAALRALEIDDTLAEAHTSLGAVKAYFDWDWSGAEAEFQRGIELNPHSSEAHRQYGCYLSAVGRRGQAIAEAELARELDPLSLNANNDLGLAYCFARLHDRAIERLRKTLELDPKFFRSHLFLAASYMAKRMYEEALAELQEARAAPEVMAIGLAMAGRKAQAQKALATATRTRGSNLNCVFVAIAREALDERESAFEWLEKAYHDRQWHMTWLKTFPPLDPLRADARFQDLLRRMNFPL
jgi:TolB-like protein/Tfp pilus assembly protein PilF